jgi:hypothetical protein
VGALRETQVRARRTCVHSTHSELCSSAGQPARHVETSRSWQWTHSPAQLPRRTRGERRVRPQPDDERVVASERAAWLRTHGDAEVRHAERHRQAVHPHCKILKMQKSALSF